MSSVIETYWKNSSLWLSPGWLLEEKVLPCVLKLMQKLLGQVRAILNRRISSSVRFLQVSFQNLYDLTSTSFSNFIYFTFPLQSNIKPWRRIFFFNYLFDDYISFFVLAFWTAPYADIGSSRVNLLFIHLLLVYFATLPILAPSYRNFSQLYLPSPTAEFFISIIIYSLYPYSHSPIGSHSCMV